MHTLTPQPDIPGDPLAATPYFRRLAAERAVEEIAVWYAGGLDPQAA